VGLMSEKGLILLNLRRACFWRSCTTVAVSLLTWVRPEQFISRKALFNIYIYIYIYIYLHIHRRIHIYIYKYIYTCQDVWLYSQCNGTYVRHVLWPFAAMMGQRWAIWVCCEPSSGPSWCFFSVPTSGHNIIKSLTAFCWVCQPHP